MKACFDYLNDFYDKVYVLTLPRLHERIDFINRELNGLNFEFFYGTDKQDTSIATLKAGGVYSTERYLDFYKKPNEMNLGMLCCSLGHLHMYQSIIANGYHKTLILEDDVQPLLAGLQQWPQIINELPPDWDIFYLGYEKNETFGWKQKLKSVLYRTRPWHAQLKLTSAMYASYYPHTLSPHIARAGFHDCTHAYGITLEAAKTLAALQTPVAFNPDNLLSYAISTGQVNGYISRPKLFNQLSAFVHKTPSLTAG
jgi:glycosyl transferase family 25